MNYRDRVADFLLNFKLECFGAILIVGPKGCGKTTTAKHHARSFIELQDEDNRDAYISVAAVQPSRLLAGENPRLIDEWQDAPKIWGAVRKSVDDKQENGLYILTGSTSQSVETPHTGTMRISRMEMLPMSLHESGESNGTVSIAELFENPEGFSGCESPLELQDLIFAICRGGWPRAISNRTKRAQLAGVRTCIGKRVMWMHQTLTELKKTRNGAIPSCGHMQGTFALWRKQKQSAATSFLRQI